MDVSFSFVVSSLDPHYIRKILLFIILIALTIKITFSHIHDAVLVFMSLKHTIARYTVNHN